MLSKFNISGYSAAIIVIVDQYENMYLWFGIDGTSLVLQGRYDFVKK